jgi:hypothetical protein
MAPPKVSAALKRVRESLNPKPTQEEVSQRINPTLRNSLNLVQSRISRLELESEPSYDQLAALEDAMGVERGTVLTVAGYIRETKTIDRVIFTDPSLEPELVDVVLDAYRAAQRASAKLRAQRPPQLKSVPPDGLPTPKRRTRRRTGPAEPPSE